MSIMREQKLSTLENLDDLEGFILVFKARPTVNLKALVKECKLKWKDVEKEINKNGWFTQALLQVLDDYRDTLLGKIESLALGESVAGRAPNLTAIRQMIDMIDEGRVLSRYGASREEEAEGLTADQRRRLGLPEED